MKKKTNDNPFVSRNRRRTAYLSLVVCLAILVTAGVAGAFHLTGIAKTYHAVLTCTAEPKHGPGYADFFVHTHNEDCYDENGNLWCTLPEIEAHEHDASCYTTTLELICTTPESEGHHHTAECYTRVRGNLTCELSTEPVYDEEGNLVAEGHVHTDACYAWNEELSCGKTEGEGAHHHGDACYQSVTKLTCKKPVVVLHTHDEDCYTEDEDGNLHLTCGMLEVTEHVHGEECFTVYEQDDDEPEETGNEVPADGATEETVDTNEVNNDLTEENSEDGESGLVFLYPEEEKKENETGDDIVTDEVTTDEVTTDEVTTDEVTTDEATTDEVTTDEVTTDDVTTDKVTTDTTEEKQEEPTPEPETPPQIRSLGGEKRGATVLAEIPDGVLNEYAKLELADYDADLAKATVLSKVNENAAEGEARDISAIYVIDIGFTAGGEAAFPNGEAPIRITLRANEIRSMTAPKLYHLYSGTAEQVKDAVFDTATGTVTFTSYGFSPFAVVELTGKDPAGIDMPAQNFHEWTDEIDVYVEADEGAFPAGTTMLVTAVPQEEVIDALNEAAPNAMVRNVQAVDITFYDAEGNEIEPATAIRVKMSKKTETPAPAAPAESTESVVMHVDNAGSAQIVENATVDNSTAEFESDSFSKYIFADLITEEVLDSLGNTYTISVTYGPEAKIPENSGLEVSEILETSEEYREYVARTESALGMGEGTAGYIRLFDIKIEKDGEKIQPADGTTVDVKIELKDAQADSLSVVHFADESDTGSVVQSTETEGQTVSFAADGFSVYAVVDENISVDESRMTLNFYNGSTLLATVYVKNGDDTDVELEQIIYDPGAGVLNSGELFKGWSLDKLNYTTTDAENSKSVEDIRAWAKEKANADSIVEGEVHNFYAMIYKTFAVTFRDVDEAGRDNGVTIHSEALIFKADGAGATYTVNQPYTPKSQDADFQGWYWTSPNGTGVTFAEDTTLNGVQYQAGAAWPQTIPIPNNTSVVIKDNVVFSPVVPDGYWLSFNENGKGATYTPPQFIPSSGDTVTVEPPAPSRQGYTFGGWYTDEACTTSNKFTFGSKLSGRTDLYAKWISAATADYTILIWKQNLNGDGYDFAESIRLTGTVGQNVNTVTQQGTGNSAYARVNGTNKQYTGFHLKNFDSNVEIKPEGNAVVNIYYDRTEYTLTFQIKGGYIEATDNSGTQYGLVNGEYVQLTRTGYYNYRWSYTRYNYTLTNDNDNNPQKYDANGTPIWRQNGQWWYYEGNYLTGQYNGSPYTRSEITEEYTGTRYKYTTDWCAIKEITALYEQNISENFPIEGTNGVTYDNGERWKPQSNNQGWTEVMVFVETMPAESVTFRLDTAERPLKTMYYYVEALPTDTTDIVTHNGTRYVLYNTVKARYNGVTEEDFVELDGFTKYQAAETVNGSALTTRSFSGLNGQYYIASTTEDQSIYFFYTRDKYRINYMDGVYVDGNDNPVEEPNQGQWKVTDNIYYQADISSYNKGGANYYAPTKPGYAFEGWYIDDACTHPYTFTTMPKDGVTVYAKWRQIQYRVFMHPNVPTSDLSLDWGNQEMSFRVSYGDKIAGGNDVKGTRNDYELIGWYTDEACTKPFNFDAYVLNDTTVTQAYDKTQDTELDKYGNPTETGNKDATNNRFWITRKLDLYAKWRSKIVGAPGINVQYDAVEGQGVFADGETLHTDPLTYYLDRAEATGQAASVPTDTTKQFMYWVVQTWDKDQNKYVDTDEHVYPGDTFEVQKANARVEDITTTTPGVNKRYTVQLRAEYKDKDAPTPTHIWWFPNDVSVGTTHEATTADDDLKINEAVTIPNPPVREGYKFLGWARVNSTTSESSRLGEGAGMPTGKGLSLSADDLFFTYHEPANGNEGYYTAFINETDKRVTKAAADEADPYHDMYAVWQSNTIKFTKQVEVEGSLTKADVDHTIYIALTKGDKETYVRTGPNDWDPILVKEIQIVNGVPTPNTVSFDNLEPGDYNVWELKANPYNGDPERLGVSDVFPIQDSNPLKNFAVKRISGSNNAHVEGGSVAEVELTNTYAREEDTPVTFVARKVWVDRDMTRLTADKIEGFEATFSLFKKIEGSNDILPVMDATTGKQVSITLNGQEDNNTGDFRETDAWTATFDNLPRYENDKRITYMVQETAVNPEGYYPWKDLYPQINYAYTINSYLEHSGGVIYNRKLMLEIRLDKHFDFQPNMGYDALTYQAFINDKTTQEKLKFRVTDPTGKVMEFTLADFAPEMGVTTFSKEIDVPYFSGLYLPEGYTTSTVYFEESKEADLLKEYNYYICNVTPDTGGSPDASRAWKLGNNGTDDLPEWISANSSRTISYESSQQLVEIRIQNKYRRGTEWKINNLNKTVIGLPSTVFENYKEVFKNLHFVIQDDKTHKYYGGKLATPVWNPETKREEKINWVSSIEQATILAPQLLNYNGSEQQGWSSGDVQLVDPSTNQALEMFPSGNYTVIELEAREEGYNEHNINIANYTLSVEGTKLDLPDNGTASVETTTDQLPTISITNRYTPVTGSVEFYKVASDKEEPDRALPGAEFTLYTDASCADDKIAKDAAGNNAVATSSSADENKGKVSFTNIPVGTYYMKETQAPEGYAPITTIYEVVIDKDPTKSTIKEYKDGAASGYNISEIVNEPGNVEIKLFKYDLTSTANPKKGLGATFTVYKAEDVDTTTEKPIQGKDPVLTITTDSSTGFSTKYELPIGTYYLFETEAPAGYNMMEHPWVITIDLTNQRYPIGITSNKMTINNAVEVPDNDKVYTIQVPNNPGVELPSTGGRGTGLFTAIGAILSGTAGAILTLRKRKA